MNDILSAHIEMGTGGDREFPQIRGYGWIRVQLNRYIPIGVQNFVPWRLLRTPLSNGLQYTQHDIYRLNRERTKRLSTIASRHEQINQEGLYTQGIRTCF